MAGNANFTKATRLLKRVILSNLFLPSATQATAVLSGSHGQGKTAICNKISTVLGGSTLTVEGGSTKEGEVTGIPVLLDGKFQFAKYFQVEKIKTLQKHIYNLARKGFETHKVKLNDDGTTTYELDGKTYTIPAKTTFDKIIDGADENGDNGDNMYSFGDELPGIVKLDLIRSHEIRPIILFIDEMNRTIMQVMKEFMNILLTKVINGYRLPWWVFFVSAINPATQDSRYAVNEFDDAQLDRLLIINFKTTLEEWQDHAIDVGLPPIFIQAVDYSNFSAKDNNSRNDDAVSPTPSPRSLDVIGFIKGCENEINNSGFFTPEEIRESENDLAFLIKSKVGDNAGSSIISKMKCADKLINHKDVINGKSETIDERLKSKISNSENAILKILCNDITRALSTEELGKYLFKEDKESVKIWKNIGKQIGEFVSVLTPTMRVLFASMLSKTSFDIPQYESKYKNGKVSLWYEVATNFAKDVIDQLVDLKKGLINE